MAITKMCLKDVYSEFDMTKQQTELSNPGVRVRFAVERLEPAAF